MNVGHAFVNHPFLLTKHMLFISLVQILSIRIKKRQISTQHNVPEQNDGIINFRNLKRQHLLPNAISNQYSSRILKYRDILNYIIN